MSKFISTALIGFITIILLAAPAQADERYNPVKDKMTIAECGACHMAFQPQMLPSKSWKKIIGGLSDHFGEDASLADKSVAHLMGYHVDNAADSKWWGGKFMRGLSDSSAPLRITETPYWVREHNEEVPQWAWNDPKVKSKANCAACHPRATKGDYDDD